MAAKSGSSYEMLELLFQHGADVEHCVECRFVDVLGPRPLLPAVPNAAAKASADFVRVGAEYSLKIVAGWMLPKDNALLALTAMGQVAGN